MSDDSPADVGRSQTVDVNTVLGSFEVVISLLPFAAVHADATAVMQVLWLGKDQACTYGTGAIRVFLTCGYLEPCIYIYIHK